MSQAKTFSRRDFLRLSTLTAAGAVLAACAPLVPSPLEKEPIPSDSDAESMLATAAVASCEQIGESISVGQEINFPSQRNSNRYDIKLEAFDSVKGTATFNQSFHFKDEDLGPLPVEVEELPTTAPLASQDGALDGLVHFFSCEDQLYFQTRMFAPETNYFALYLEEEQPFELGENHLVYISLKTNTIFEHTPEKEVNCHSFDEDTPVTINFVPDSETTPLAITFGTFGNALYFEISVPQDSLNQQA